MVVPLGPGKFYGTSLPRPRIYTDVKLNDERVDPPVRVMDALLSWANEAHWSMGGLSFKRLRLQGRIEGSVTKLRAQRERIAKNKTKLAAKSSSARSDRSGSKRKEVINDDDTDAEDDDDYDDSPPPAPIATKRRKFMDLIDKDADNEIGHKEEASGAHRVRRRRLVKKLGDDFDKVASENEEAKETPDEGLSNGGSGSVGSRARRQILEDTDAPATETVMKVVEEVNKLRFEGKKSKGSVKCKGKSGGASGSAPASRVRTSPRLAKKE
ncbi:hypothetical protein PanWU01x14_228330 [Parasponia andersonii]|uniref:Uncharacterized protein n=1 Tax=Parasponia andersonii TaxID=3476 RepID=A0A2P5BLH8_PARAD|nr:hypothetical protein PanWU01x14_228330 [Parasponia andersonii]